ncbi:MAG TPA: hypothetical protein VFP50_16405 [Anaeromyxobacteraceae bacterium]|nr:hypothetical protein [Anaeromyxobacteraceae bacterium]
MDPTVLLAVSPEAGSPPRDETSGRRWPLPPDQLALLPYREALGMARRRATRDYLVALLGAVDGNVTRAAERAGMARESLHRLLKRFGLRSEEFKARPPAGGPSGE